MINGPPSFKYHEGFRRFVIYALGDQILSIFECIVKKELFYKTEEYPSSYSDAAKLLRCHLFACE